jgi:hypothetical protein
MAAVSNKEEDFKCVCVCGGGGGGGGEVKVIRETESGEKKTDMCQEFSLVNSTIQTIWENRDKIVSAFNQNGSGNKEMTMYQ